MLRSAGATAVLVTHDQEEALSFASRVAVLRGGRIAQVADPATLYRHPVDLEVGRFVGESVSLPGRVLESAPPAGRTERPAPRSTPNWDASTPPITRVQRSPQVLRSRCYLPEQIEMVAVAGAGTVAAVVESVTLLRTRRPGASTHRGERHRAALPHNP
ncbi:MAG: hypothetical protein R2789_16100 [Microthrixaceae bacterium]